MKQECILITGANGVLGSALVDHFTSRNIHVVAVSRGNHKPKMNCTPLAVDLLAPQSIETVRSFLIETGLKPTGFIHAARSKEFLKKNEYNQIPLQHWLSEYQIAVPVVYDLVQALSTSDVADLDSVVLLSSIYGCVAQKPSIYETPETSLVPHYGAAKAATIHLARTLAIEHAPRIRINTVSFGGIENTTNTQLAEKYGAECPQGRMLHVSEVVGPVSFLLSDAASGITGQNIIVDGGWTAW